MPRMEIFLDPALEWQEESLEDWCCALGAFLCDTGVEVKRGFRLPGYEVLEIQGEEIQAELILSASERLMVLEGFPVGNSQHRDMAQILLRFARNMGAERLFIPAESNAETEFWRQAGALPVPDPQPLKEKIRRDRVGVESLGLVSLLVRYRGKPALCLELIRCSVHAPGLVSLAGRRLERHFGGPLGFASRVAAQCPWDIEREQWDDLLAFSRLKAFEVLAERLEV